MDLSATHARAVAAMQRANAPAVTFRLDDPGTPNPTTGGFTGGGTVQVSGYAVRVKGEPEANEAGEGTREGAVNLLFIPATLGGMPPFGGEVTWESVRCRVVSRKPISPTGQAVGTYVTVAP